MQRGGSVADVWVVRRNPVDRDTMLTRPVGPFARSGPGVLPSRAADNLYWLGRYVERAEHMVRLTRAYHLRIAETAYPDTPLLSEIADYLEVIDVPPQVTTTRALPFFVFLAISQVQEIFPPSSAARAIWRLALEFVSVIAARL